MGRANCTHFTQIAKKEGDAMRRIVINMQNSLFCNAIADTLRRSGNELEPHIPLTLPIRSLTIVSGSRLTLC